ncbi:transmembrane protein 53-A-like [Cololabis saira]|uniref:transmembrane protein 53-A-like n=1 Tax=Cololabis saira TaxID=129043 RepID=UPI002AD42F9C|nr:transmembrane protein 53-A-like [Cololabis saira]
MGNLRLSTGLKTDAATSEQVGKLISRRICSGMTYYYAPVTEAEHQTVSPVSTDPAARDDSPSESRVAGSAPKQPRPRPLLLFFSWLGAHPAGVAKYMDLYAGQGLDILLVQSRVMHFLWPRWGLDYGLEILKVLEEPPFSGREVLVHAASIGGYTFTQMLVHISQEPKKHAGLTRRVVGQVYDSLVVGSLEHMATGLGQTLAPRFESLVRNSALLYFWLFRSYTADLYESSVQVFHQSPVTAPALFFFSQNDAMCDAASLERLMALWRGRGVAVADRKWAESTHAAHLRRHPEDYVSTLRRFLGSIPAGV